jgi:hypothetical protein
MRPWRAHRAAIPLLFVGLLGVTTLAWGQFANQTGNVVGTVGGACNSGLNDYAWPDTNGNILKCVSSVWTLVTQPATAAGSTGYVQFNNGGVLAGSANHFWDNTNNRLGIGTTAPGGTLSVNGSAAFGTYGGNNTAPPANTLIVSGGLGVGTNNPTALLNVFGQVKIGSFNAMPTNLDVWILGRNGNALRLEGGQNPGAWGTEIMGNTTANADILRIGTVSATGGSPTILDVFDKSGNVAIGSTAPVVGATTYGLYVQGGVYFNNNITANNGQIQIGAGNAFVWNTRSTMTSPSNGIIKFGNNTQTDFSRLDFGGTTSAFPAINSINTSTGAQNALQVIAADGSSNANLLVTGNIGIGTNVPAYLLHVGSAAASGIVEELQNSSGNCTFQPSSSALQVICSSDRRLKDDIDDAVPALPQLADMRVRNYTIKASGERTIGVIAQEMIWKHPDLVHMGPDGYYGVEAPNVWLLVKAIQELKAANDDMAEALNAANDNIADLRESFEAYKSAHP